MQTSSRMSKAKVALRAAIAVVIIVLLNVLVSYALTPSASKNAVVWEDYKKAENVDTLFLGSSLTYHAADPNTYDEITDSNTLTLASADQSPEESLQAIKTAIADHPIKRVVYGVSFSELRLATPANPGSVFMRSRANAVPIGETSSSILEILFRYGGATGANSINGIFPWIEAYAGPAPSGIAENIRQKQSPGSVYEKTHAIEPVWEYRGKGYGAYSGVMNYDTEVGLYFSDTHDNDVDTPFDEVHMRALADLCDYCGEHGIELVVVSLPYPEFTIMAAGEGFYTQDDTVRQLVEAHGASFYDFNLASDDLLVMQPEFFYDYAHLNGAGAQAFTAALAKVVQMKEADEDPTSLFLTPEEHVQSLSHAFSAVLADASVEGDSIAVTARAFAGNEVDVEYQLNMKPSGSDSWSYEGEWVDSNEFTMTPEQHCNYTIRVSARPADRPDMVRYSEVEVYY